VAEAQKGQAVVKRSTERKHLTNVVTMAAYQIEIDLLESDTPRGAGGLVSGAASKAVVPLVEASR
jgi:hypothetical protein